MNCGLRIADCGLKKRIKIYPRSEIRIAIISGEGKISNIIKKKIKNSVLIKLPLKPNIDDMIEVLKKEGIKMVVFAGKFEKKMLYETEEESFPKNDDESIIKGVSERFGREGIRVLNQKKWLLEFIAKKGELTSIKPKINEWEDIKQGIMVAKKLNKFDIGQTICIKERIVISLEALEGTDETIKRAGKITNNFVVVKYGKKGREIPIVGEKTIKVMKAASARILAVRSNVVLILPKTIGFAEKSNISLVGI